MKRKMTKPTALLVSLLLILSVTVGGTLAFLLTRSGPVENTFTPSTVTTSVVEDFDGNVKKEVQIKNTGDTAAYIRAAVIITWQDGDGNVYGQKPAEGTDYTITWFDDDVDTANDYWKQAADGFYYWTKPVAATDSTGYLIMECKPVADKAPAGYSLCVEILGSGIQSQPTTVVTTEWDSGVGGIKVENGVNLLDIIPPTTN